jgi:adenylate cyclase
MVGRIRLWSAYVLLLYVTMHLLNHAVGLASLRALEETRAWFMYVWENPVGHLVLYGALLVHFTLAMWSVFRRRALRLSFWEWTQLALGASIVPMAAAHVTGTRIATDYFGIHDGYPWVLASLTAGTWMGVVRQFGLVIVVWIHACIGLHFAWRLRPWYRDWLPALYAVALLVPAAALGGAGVALRDFAYLAAERLDFLADLFDKLNAPDAENIARIYRIADSLAGASLALLLASFAGRPLRDLWQRRVGVVQLTYGDRQVVSLPAGHNVLEMSRIGGPAVYGWAAPTARCCRRRPPRSRRCSPASPRRRMYAWRANSSRRPAAIA